MDYARATFVQNDFRYEVSEDVTVKATYDGAREIILETNGDSATASSLATQLLAATKTPNRLLAVEIKQALKFSDFDGSPPRFTVTIDDLAMTSVTMTCVQADINEYANITLMVLR